jgi:hypothetical protein
VKQQLRDWVNSSVYTRFNDPSKSALKLPLIAEESENAYTYIGKTIMWRQPGEVLNPSRMSIAEVELMRARIAPHVFASQYQQRPATGGTGYCSIERLARYAEAPPFELIVHSWDIASTKGGGDWTVCAKFGLAKSSDGREILYLTGIIHMQVELPDVGEAIAGLIRRRSRPSSFWMVTGSAGASFRNWDRGNSSTYCQDLTWSEAARTAPSYAVSTTGCSTSTTVWCGFRVQCRGARSKPCSPKSQPSPMGSTTIRSTP